MDSNAIYILDALRTPIGNIDGSLAALTAPQLGVPVVKELIRRYPLIREKTSQLILGNSVSAGVGQNPARQTAILGGINLGANAFTVNQVCGSGLSVVGLAKAVMIDQGAQVVLAGAVESCSNMPYLVDRRKDPAETEGVLRESLREDGLQCPIEEVLMGEIAEEYAQEYAISRVEQDDFALLSQEKAHRAEQQGLYRNERIPLTEESASLNCDEKIRHNLSPQKLARLRPVYQEGGTVTAGNTAGMGDCGCLLLLASGEFIKKNGLKPKARVLDTYSLGTPMKSVFTGPAQVLSQLLRKNGFSAEDIDLFEVCEAFACTVVGFLRETKIPREKVNIYGGDIALGHPLGASGARMAVTLTNALGQEEKRLGVVLMSMGGGHSIGILMERPRDLAPSP